MLLSLAGPCYERRADRPLSALLVLLSPLQDMPIFGRNPIYIIGLFLFVVFQIPVIFAPNIATVLVFRFLAGFVASPAIATGGASMAGERTLTVLIDPH